MYGVPKNKVILQPHNISWAEEFNKEKEKFLSIFAKEIVMIEHVGSTAIPGIAAKPMLDIAIVFNEITESIFRKMEKAQYTYYGEVAPGKYLFLLKRDNGDSLQHIHCYESSNLQLFHEQIRFRDYLMTHTEYALEYEKLKMDLCKLYCDDRKSYTAGKQAFFDKIKYLTDTK